MPGQFLWRDNSRKNPNHLVGSQLLQYGILLGVVSMDEELLKNCILALRRCLVLLEDQFRELIHSLVLQTKNCLTSSSGPQLRQIHQFWVCCITMLDVLSVEPFIEQAEDFLVDVLKLHRLRLGPESWLACIAHW